MVAFNVPTVNMRRRWIVIAVRARMEPFPVLINACKAYEFAMTEDNYCTACPNRTVPNDDRGDCIACKEYEIVSQHDYQCGICGARLNEKRLYIAFTWDALFEHYTECPPGYYNEKEGSCVYTLRQAFLSDSIWTNPVSSMLHRMVSVWEWANKMERSERITSSSETKTPCGLIMVRRFLQWSSCTTYHIFNSYTSFGCGMLTSYLLSLTH